MAATVDGESESKTSLNNNTPSNPEKESGNSAINYQTNKKYQEICDTFGGYNVDELYVLATNFLKGRKEELMMMWT